MPAQRTSVRSEGPRLAGVCRLTVVIIAASIFASGCGFGGGKLLVIESPTGGIEASTITIREAEPSVMVPASSSGRLLNELNDHLVGEHFAVGPDLVLEVEFVKHDLGSRFWRWCVGFGIGKGGVRVQARYFDAEGNKLAAIEAEGTTQGGFFGGSNETAIDMAAKEIADFTRERISLGNR